MGKNVLILSASPRKGGNSDTLCDAFMAGALESGHQVEKIFLRDQKIAPCKGCYTCRKNGGSCVIEDDMAEILERMQVADVIVMATPIYFYAISAQMKMVLDRSMPRWLEMAGKEFYYLLSAARTEEWVADGTLASFRGFTYCLGDAKECGVIVAKGVRMVGEILDTSYPQEAYEMGKHI